MASPSDPPRDDAGARTTKKRRLAMLVGYIGTGYQGLQKNPGAKTIEEEFENALHKVGMIHDYNMGDLKKIGWNRAGRTDKGVHAVRQVLCAKLELPRDIADENEPEFLQQQVHQINEVLPPSLRAFRMLRVTNGFSAKNSAESREYEYLLPTIALAPWRKEARAPAADAHDSSAQDDEFQIDDTLSVRAQDVAHYASLAKGGYAPDAEAEQRLATALQRFEGTHNFHNFTQKMEPTNGASMRFMRSFRVVGRVTVGEGEGARSYLRLVVHGDSFMLHQIRKMVSCAVLVARQQAPLEYIDVALGRNKADVPIAPGHMLFLNKVFYSAYEDRVSRQHNRQVSLDAPEAAEDFKQQVLFPHLVELDEEKKHWSSYLAFLDQRWTDFFERVAAMNELREKGEWQGEYRGPFSRTKEHQDGEMPAWKRARQEEHDAARAQEAATPSAT